MELIDNITSNLRLTNDKAEGLTIKINVDQIFKLWSPSTEVKSI